MRSPIIGWPQRLMHHLHFRPSLGGVVGRSVPSFPLREQLRQTDKSSGEDNDAENGFGLHTGMAERGALVAAGSGAERSRLHAQVGRVPNPC